MRVNKSIVTTLNKCDINSSKLPLHLAQQEVYYDQITSKESPNYNVGGYVIFKGEFKKNIFFKVIKELPKVFDAFRIRFHFNDEKPQCSLANDSEEIDIKELDFSQKGEAKSDALAWMQQRFNQIFDLQERLLHEQFLLKIAEDEYWWFQRFHHLITDGYGFVTFLHYVANQYSQLETIGLKKDTEYPQYFTEIEPSLAYESSESYTKDAEYWQKQFKTLGKPVLEKSISLKTNRSHGSGRFIIKIPQTRRQLWKTVEQKTNTSIQQLTLAAFTLYFGKTKGREEITFGTTLHKRRNKRQRKVVGMFSGVLPFKGKYVASETVESLLLNIKQQQRQDYRHQSYPISHLNRHLKLLTADQGQLFDIIVNNAALDFELDFTGLDTESHELLSEQVDVPLQLWWGDHGQKRDLELRVDFRKEYFSLEEAKLLSQRILFILDQFPHALHHQLNYINILPEKEKKLLLNDFSKTADYAIDGQSVVDLFETQVKRLPTQIALTFNNQQLTYQQLNTQANQLAHFLIAQGVQAKNLVAICLERSIDMVIAILGVIKIGATYVPLDPDYPQGRINFMLEDTKAKWVISNKQHQPLLGNSTNCVWLDDHHDAIAEAPSSNLGVVIREDDLIYIIYTSGSTGKPKGVMLRHSSIVNLIKSRSTEFDFNQTESVLQFSNIAFDASVEQIFLGLLNGANLVLLQKEALLDPSHFQQLLLEKEITHLDVTPGFLENIPLRDFPSLRRIVVGGEACPLALAERWAAHYPFYNAYGPTEAAVTSLSFKYEKNAITGHHLPIGKPIGNTQVIVLNQTHELVPIGQIGELYLAGKGLAKGYLNQPKLTTERFSENSYFEDKRFYKTGDLVIMRPNGLLEYIGRADDQVKIRGYRIELGEIEVVLQRSPLVKQAVVIAQKNIAETSQLLAYVIPQNDYDTASIQAYLKSVLPHYMLPSFIMELDEFPLNSSGKIDKKALPSLSTEAVFTTQYRAPRNTKEEHLLAIWETLLGNLHQHRGDQFTIGIDDNFFELGGHSLLATRLVTAIREELVIEIAIKDIFEAPTIAGLSALMAEQVQSRALPKIVAQEHPSKIPLAFSQERIWFIDQLEGSSHYHMPGVFTFTGKLNVAILEKAFNAIINRHTALRTVIKKTQKQAFQEVLGQDEFKLQTSHYNETLPTAKLDALIEELSQQPFDLSADYMIRVQLMTFPDHKGLLLVVLHHIAADGWSLPILLNELIEVYRTLLAKQTLNLPVLPIQFADFALWQHQVLSGHIVEGQLAYWEGKLKGISPLNLPLDFPRPATQKLKGSTIHLALDQEITAALKELASSHNATLFMTLLAAFKVLLYRYTGQTDICVGTAIANRQQQEMEGLIGFFVNTLALRSDLAGNPNFSKVLNRVKETTLEAYAYQDTPFDKVVDSVAPERELNRNPLFQTMFVLQNTPEMQALQLGDVALELAPLRYQMAKFDLTFTIEESVNGLAIQVEYSKDLFLETTVNRLIHHYQQLLKAIVHDPSQEISQLSLLNEFETKQLITDFNPIANGVSTLPTVVELFEKQVQVYPSCLAAVFKETEVTFYELNTQANKLAHHLQHQGVKSQDLVAVCLTPSIEMVATVLAILKASAIYVPLDPKHPQERINYILEDTQATCLITSNEVLNTLDVKENSITIVSVDRDQKAIAQQSAANLTTTPVGSALAYVIYTSGSTGKPKGVLIRHDSLSNYLDHSISAYMNKEENHQTSGSYVHLSTTFDASLTALFTPFMAGKAIVISSSSALEVFSDSNFLKYAPYDFIKLTPAHLQLIKPLIGKGLQALTNRFVVGGEALQLSDFQYFIDEGIAVDIINEYGPTEATVGCTTYSFNTLGDFEIGLNGLLIGKPVRNTAIYVLASSHQLAPIGVAGELCIGGAQLAQGYLNRSDLSNEKFIQHPFHPTEKLYKTGDLARWRENGELEYLGRIDQQVKLNGYRIELGEIEHATQELKTVSTSCVVLKEEKGSKKLIHYFVPDAISLKAQAKKLHEKQVANWQDLYVEEYKDTSFVEDEEFNVTGWGDSFTGGQLPNSHMTEWLDDIIRTILADPTQQVLEIGCGTGLIYYRLADHIKQYTGFDLSITAIHRIESQIAKAEKTYPKTELAACPAHEISLNTETEIDTIIINSVIQYFPGEEYLSDVLDKSLSFLKGKGRIIVGDVRHYGLLTDFKRHIQFNKAADKQAIKDFEWQVTRSVLNDQELCISPTFFYQLKAQHPEITHIDIEYKQGKYINEMSLYRYNVVIYVGDHAQVEQAEWLSWDSLTSISQLEEQLTRLPDQLAISDLPNPRLWQERLLAEGVQKSTISRVKDLRKLLLKGSSLSDQFNELFAKAEKLAYSYQLFVHQDPMKMNLLLRKQSHPKKHIANPFDIHQKSTSELSNIPLFIEAALVLQKEIKEQLSERLPQYMLPAKHIAVQQLPLTSNGKIDRTFLNQLETGVTQLEGNYQAPSSPAELALADIWANLLHLEKVGIHDNFFELGGDSIITIQVVSRAKKAGLMLEPRDLFQHQTIAHLAKALRETATRVHTAEQGILVGEAPLLPIQQWFFEKNLKNPSWYNQALLLNVNKQFAEQELNQALQAVILQHDALRFSYQQENGNWKQYYGTPVSELRQVDLTSLSKTELSTAIHQFCENSQQQLDITQGNLMQVTLIETPTWETENRLLFIIHHLAIDGVSWRILLHDFELAIQQLQRQEEIDLGIKSSSYRDWGKALSEELVLTKMMQQMSYWQGIKPPQPLPVDHIEEENLWSNTISQKVQLSVETTSQLLQTSHQAYGTEINELLLAALAKTITTWSGNTQLVVGLEGHGREHIATGLTTDATIGWFTSLFPVGIELEQDLPLSIIIKSVKEQIRALPDKGVGYGILRYLHPDAAVREKLSTIRWELVFNYLGQLDNALQTSTNFSIAQESTGNSVSPTSPVDQPLEINSSILKGRLMVEWTYSTKQYESETIAKLASDYLDNLSAIIAHCQAQTEAMPTPSDFGLQQWLTYKELDTFLDEVEKGQTRRAQISALYPLSPMQEGLLFHDLLHKESSAYIEQTCVDLSQEVDINALKTAWQFVVHHHTILRTAFYPTRFSLPIQAVMNATDLPFELIDLSGDADDEKATKVAAFLAQDQHKGFDVEQAPLMRISVLKLSAVRYKLVWTSHHILIDGWTSAIIFAEVLSAYEELTSGHPPTEKSIDHYQDFIHYLQRKDAIVGERFWKEYMKGFETPSLLPFVTNTTNRNKTVGEAHEVSLLFDDVFTTKIKHYAKTQHITVNTLLQGVWATLLSRYTGLTDIVFGATVSGRPSALAQAEQRVGLFINTIPVRVKLPADANLASWLIDIQNDHALAREHQYNGLNEIQAWSTIKGDLFDSLFVFENYPMEGVLSQDWKLKIDHITGKAQTNYPLSIIAVELNQQLNIKFNYNSALLNAATVKQIKSHFQAALLAIIEQPQGKLNELEILSTQEQDQLLIAYNQTNIAYPATKTVIELFEEQVIKTPNATALTFKGQTLPYHELDQQANQLGHYLRKKEVIEGDFVAISLNRSLDVIVGLLGILKAGGVYVPIDPTYPKERRHFLLQDADARVLLTDSASKPFTPTGLDTQLVVLDEEWQEIEKCSTDKLPLQQTAEDLVYMMYTSGSTGQPKGVHTKHQAIARLIFNPAFDFLTEQAVMYQFAPTAFDASTFEIWGALLKGGKLVISNPEQQSLEDMATELKSSGVNVLWLTAGLFHETVTTHIELFEGLTHLLAGGDSIRPDQVKKVLEHYPELTFINGYGPTESTTFAVVNQLEHVDELSMESNIIGKPIGNTKAYVLHPPTNLLSPIGCQGELCLAGPGLALGYHNRPALTQQKFISNPFMENDYPIIYRTGDLVRWLPSGELEFLGRIDQQVKIRGYRVELGEIESVLHETIGVNRAIVLAPEAADGNRQLIAYIVPNNEYQKEETLAHLKHQLPAYMVPTYLIEIEKIPLTVNGKIDKGALPSTDEFVLANTTYVPPSNELEEQLVVIWKKLLTLEQIGVHDNFFELGGHSLLATRMVAEIKRELDMSLELKMIFELPNIASISQHLQLQQSNTLLDGEEYELIEL